MRAICFSLLLLLPLAGCGWGEAEPPVADAADGEAPTFNAQLASSLKEAAAQEQKGDYTSAIATWEKVVASVVAEHGEESWQATNARLAIEAAKKRSELPAKDRNRLELLAQSEHLGMQAITRNPREATYHLAEAERLVREIYGEDSHLLRNIHLAQAESLAAMDDRAAAKELLATVFAWRAEHLGRNHPDTLAAISRLGELQQTDRDYHAAAASLSTAMEIARQVWGDEHANTAEHISNVAMLESEIGQYDQAVVRLEQVLKVRRANLEAAGDNEKLAETSREGLSHALYNAGNVELKRGRLDQGIAYLKEAWEFKDPEGKGMAMTIAKSYSYALAAQRSQPSYAEAEKVTTKLKEWQEARGGPSHPGYANTLYELAVIQGNQGRFPDAAATMDEAVKVERSLRGTESPQLANMLSVQAQLLRRTGDIAKAEVAEAELERLRAGGTQTATRPR